MKDPQTAVGSALDPRFLMRSTMHPNRPGRDIGWQVEPATARFLGIARFGAAASIVTTTGAFVITVVGIRISILLSKQNVVVIVGRHAHRVRGIVHTRLLAGAIFASMAETEDMANLLTHDVAFLIGVGLVRGVAVVHLCRALVDVSIGINADGRDTEPTIIPITGIADPHLSSLHSAPLAGTIRVVGGADTHIEHT